MNSHESLNKIIAGNSLSDDESYSLMISIMRGEISEILLSSILTALKIKGETENEIYGFARAMRDSCIKLEIKMPDVFIDTCGTGGDGKNTVNVSTLTALVLYSMGIIIAKHGNRAVSSLSGSSDILQSLGFDLSHSPSEVVRRFNEDGFAFLFAPEWHPSMKYAVPVRKALGFRTVFNLLGPLSNPFSPPFQVIGVFNDSVMPMVSKAAIKLGMKGVIVCHSEDGQDEFSVFAKTKYIIYKDGEHKEKIYDPSILGLSNLKHEEMFCSSKENAVELFKNILHGEELAASHAVALNTGVALYLIGKSDSIESGYKDALAILKSGKTAESANKLINKWLKK